MAQLEFIGSSNVVERRSLTRGQTITVGRARDMDISIEDQLVSSSHAQFVADVIGLRVIDTGSKNGVFVNTVASKDVLLKAIPLTLSRPPSEKS